MFNEYTKQKCTHTFEEVFTAMCKNNVRMVPRGVVTEEHRAYLRSLWDYFGEVKDETELEQFIYTDRRYREGKRAHELKLKYNVPVTGMVGRMVVMYHRMCKQDCLFDGITV